LEVADFSKMLVSVYWTAQCHISEDHYLTIHCH